MTEPAKQPDALAPLAASVTFLTETSTVESVLDLMNQVSAVQERLRSIKAQLDEAVIAWVQQNGEIVCGNVRYYVAPDKTTKIRKGMTEQAIRACAEACGKDFDRFVRLFASDSLKHGTCKAVLGERWKEFFETTIKSDIQTGEVPVKVQRGLVQE